MRKITVSAPGKLMLMGEHTVVYGRPCIVTAIDQRLKVTIELIDESLMILSTQDIKFSKYQRSLSEIGKGEVPKEAKFVEFAVYNFLQKYKIPKGVSISTVSEFSANFGFGSSSAVSVGVTKALSELMQSKLSNKELFDLSYKTVLDVQGVGSGFDVASAIFGGTIYFQTGGKIIESLSVNDMSLVVGYSGVKADTVSMMNLVSEKMKNYKEGVEKIFGSIANLILEAKKAILEKDWQRLGTLMDFNQNYLEDLGVSTQKLNQMIVAAKKAGAYGAKLSGAGGGDCMIALVSKKTKSLVEEAIIKVGGEIIDVKIGAEGVKIL